MKVSTTRRLLISGLALTALVVGSSSCGNDPAASPRYLQDKYGLTDASTDRVAVPEEGSVPATVVPVTLADGRKAQLIIPQRRSEYPVYLRDESGIEPVVVDRNVTREQFLRSRPVMVERRQAPATRRHKRPLRNEVLIVAGGTGAGAAIGGLAGGGKGAAIGALSGGVTGLVYDLATRRR